VRPRWKNLSEKSRLYLHDSGADVAYDQLQVRLSPHGSIRDGLNTAGSLHKELPVTPLRIAAEVRADIGAAIQPGRIRRGRKSILRKSTNRSANLMLTLCYCKVRNDKMYQVTECHEPLQAAWLGSAFANRRLKMPWLLDE
jgi:hypothetical protein